MATTTPNFGFDIPQSTDLVKDGATAIAALGTDIDTAFVDLKGGTTGQYLKKNSNSDLDYVWGDVSAGGMTLISTTTLSGASVTLSSIPSTYNDLRLVLRLPLPATDGNYLTFNYNSDTGSNYFGTNLGSTFYDGNPITTGAFVTSAYLTADSAPMDNTVTQGTVIWNVYDYANSSTYKFSESRFIANSHTTTTSIYLGAYKQIWRSTSAISSITLQFVAGNFTSGTVLLYGVK